jgi:D-sedoheptulose 7-phosphate isomerase
LTDTARRRIHAHLEASAALKVRVATELGAAIVAAADMLGYTFASGRKVLLCGNGGSAADAQHMAAELVNGLTADHRGRALPAIALTTDTSILTACANDQGYEHVFARQVAALGNPGDVLVAISTSGRSPNVLAAIAEARRRGLRVVGLTGAGATMDADVALAVPSRDTQLIQEAHLSIEHLLCELAIAALEAAEQTGAP